jgi:putative ABC transport system permease protein
MLRKRLHDLWRRLNAVIKGRQLDRDLAEELECHLAMREQKLIEQGMAPREARYAAQRCFGNIVSLRETSREMWGFPSLETLLQDVRYGLRMLRHSPGFTALAVITLALGIGGTTTIFSLVYGALLDPFPYVDSHRLTVLISYDKTSGGTVEWKWVSSAEFLDYQEQNHVFDELIGSTAEDLPLTGTDVPELLRGVWVTTNTFRVLGVPPLIGRPIIAEDGRLGAPRVAVLSYKVWQSKFGGEPGIVGRTIFLNLRPTTVIGVMPPRFGWRYADLWLPATPSRGRVMDQPQDFAVIGHLRPGVTIEQANADVAVLAKRFAAAYQKDHSPDTTLRLESLADSVNIDLGDHRKTHHIFLGAVGLLLLISCVNVANLLLARATAREKEFAIRASLGAGRGRLIRQLTIESLLLALGGAALGCGLAFDLLRVLVALIPEWYIPTEAMIRINGPVLLFTLSVALLSTLLFGLAPALLAVRRDLQEPLKASGRAAGESRGHSGLRNLLVVSEVALSLVLLTGAGLLTRSFFALRHAERGYEPDNVLSAGAVLPEERYKTAEARNQFHVETLRRVRALPGVLSATLTWPSMLIFGIDIPIEIVGKSRVEGNSAWVRFSSDRFFETMGIRLLKGRTISEEDFLRARSVAVVNRAFVRKYFGDENPLGRQIRVMESRDGTVKQASFEIVGEVADTRHEASTAQPTLFVPYSIGAPRYHMVLARTVAQPISLLNSIRREIAGTDKELPGGGGKLRDDLNRFEYTEPRFVLTILTAFASLGLILVSVGVYGVLSYAVSQQTHEIGVRMALGAQPIDVRRMVMMSGLRWLLAGIAIGVPTSIALAKILQNRIWGIKSADPLTLVVVSALLIAVGLAACYFPARRATKVDPLVALRYE